MDWSLGPEGTVCGLDLEAEMGGAATRLSPEQRWDAVSEKGF